MSSEVVPKLLRLSRAGALHPGSAETYVRISRVFSAPIGWLLGDVKIVADAEIPASDASTTNVLSDRLPLADEAARKLTELDGIPPAAAWGTMRCAESRDVMGLYEEARRKLAAKKGKP